MPERYTFDNLKGGIKNPEIFVNEIRRQAYRIPFFLHKIKSKPAIFSDYGTNVMHKDWDILVLPSEV